MKTQFVATIISCGDNGLIKLVKNNFDEKIKKNESKVLNQVSAYVALLFFQKQRKES